MAKLSGGYQLLELDNIEGAYDFYDPVIQKLIHLDPTVPVIASYKGTTVFGSVSYGLRSHPLHSQIKLGYVSIKFTTTGGKLFSTTSGDTDKAQIGTYTEPVEDDDGNIKNVSIYVIGDYEPPGISIKEINVAADTLTLSSDGNVLTGKYNVKLSAGDFLAITVPVYSGSGFTNPKYPNIIIPKAKVTVMTATSTSGVLMYPLADGVEVTEYSIAIKTGPIESSSGLTNIKLTHRGKISYS